MKQAALVIAPSLLIACQPMDDAELVYDVGSKKYFVAQWGDWRRFVSCPQGTTEATVASPKPRRADTRVATHFSQPTTVTSKKIGWRRFVRSSFYECIEPGKDLK